MPIAHFRNQPIAYDDHGDIPLDVPFHSLRPGDISLYLQLDTTVGRKTCRQACTHCFYINQPAAANRSIDLVEGRRIMDCLAAQGYRVFPMISDSFGRDGMFLRLFGDTHNRDFHQEQNRRPTKTMQRGDMWTSGAPLLDAQWKEYLWTGVENGFGNVTITFHGILDSDLQLLPAEDYPIKGVFAGRDCERVIARIHAFNSEAQPAAPLDINIGVTIGKHNHTREHLLRYTAYFARLGISVLRFNAFHDHGGRLPQLPLTTAERAQWYRDLKWVHENVPLDFQLGVDEDFGSSGIEAMGLPTHVGWCRAGQQLFAIVPDPPQTIASGDFGSIEHIGSIAACVDAFQPVVGKLLRATPADGGQPTYKLEFYYEVIEDLQRKRLDGTYRDGCFAPEMLAKRSIAIASAH
ncbi:radical SAM protein [Duganella sp. HH105]|uniref:radical SAM protein n=1 Tax=Duganella sp. HH105 TaxID=1781067 RepID=UPI000877CFE1|nr:radical SAM protein [Duganella sp. HH105]OEZ59126.1 hypothetical protein DUGA6_37070 [Duganella sp. HH105]